MPTDFAKLDATSEDEIGRHMAEDSIPDLSDAILEAERGRTVWRGRRGRPRSEHSKVPINIRLSRDVLEAFKASGPGWQTRMDEALRAYLRDQPLNTV